MMLFKSINGAFSCTEAVALMNILSEAKEGVYVELGVAYGKSALVVMEQAKPSIFFLVDPEFGDIKWLNDVEFRLKMVSNKFTLIFTKLLSTDFLTQTPGSEGKFSYVMVDSGSHQDGLPMLEVKLLEDRMIDGGIIAFHDWGSQFKEVKEASDYLVGTGKYEYIPIDWEAIKSYVNENNLEEGNVSWHHNELQNPCFLAALKRKQL